MDLCMRHTDENIYSELVGRRASLAVIGLGYVGLPVAIEFAKHFNVIGYDIDRSRIDNLCDEFGESSASLKFTYSEDDLKAASFFVIAVPTPVDNDRKPDLRPLLDATHTVGRNMCRGSHVVYESTVYPGCTEEYCVPLLERESGLVCGVDFKVGYSPERINPNDRAHSIVNTVKIVGACDEEALNCIADVYGMIVSAGMHKVSCIKVAEAAKILENVQRNINIALMNEVSILFSKAGIDMAEVVGAASTKWNFMDYVPGLVGGHCIPVDPLYIVSMAEKHGVEMPLVNTGCAINDGMPAYIVRSVMNRIVGGNPVRALIMGVAFKENIGDIRNSLAAQIARLLEAASIEVDIMDPYADSGMVEEMYGLKLKSEPCAPYDLIIVAVAHDCYASLDDKYFRSIARNENTLLADVKWAYKGRITSLKYWSL